MKKTINILSIAIIVLALLQVVMMFVPTFTLARVATKKNPDPQPEGFSLMNLCFTDTEDMGKIFKKMIDGYSVNANAVPHVVAFIFAVMVIVLNILRFVNEASGYQTAYATLIRFLVHVVTFVWAYFGIVAFMDSQIMQFSDSLVPTASYIALAVGPVLGVVRLVLAFLPKFVSKKKVAA